MKEKFNRPILVIIMHNDSLAEVVLLFIGIVSFSVFTFRISSYSGNLRLNTKSFVIRITPE